MPARTYYAVVKGKDGSDVYDNWERCQKAITAAKGVSWKRFKTQDQAWDWIHDTLSVPPTASQTPQTSPSRSRTFQNTTPIRNIPIPTTSQTSPLRSRTSSIQTTPQRPKASSSKPRISRVPQSTSPMKEIPAIPAMSPNPSQEQITLSAEQQEVVEMCVRGDSLFFTGSAGTGKSVCLREIIKRLRSKYRDKVYVTASTGIAAINVEGSTLHAFAGIRLGKESVQVLVSKISRAASERWRNAVALIIDEISMIDGKLFDKLEEIARIIRDDPRPFGGIQLIICGDFFQLPPVPERESRSIDFAFDANSWESCIPNTVQLKKVFRQKDNKFIEMLNMMRLGEIDERGMELFRSLDRVVNYNDQIEPTQLFPMRDQVLRANMARLQLLPGKDVHFIATDFPGYDIRGERISQTKASDLLDRTLAPRDLTLRIGAQVMLIKNLRNDGAQSAESANKRLVNGSQGTVINFFSWKEARTEGVEVGRAEGSQADPNVNVKPSGGEKADLSWPVVRFTNGQEKMIIAEPFEVTNALGRLEASREQVPLILAWAMSIHKSQGLTLERVRVDLKGTFEKGQAYVALSRATTLDQLEVLNFEPSRIRAHTRVLEWSGSYRPKNFREHDIVVIEEDGALEEDYGFEEDYSFEWKLVNELDF